jgi:hypothetical protein
MYGVEDSVAGKPEDRSGREVGFRDQSLYQFCAYRESFGVPRDAKKGRWRSAEQYVRRQPLCGEARQGSSKHGEYTAGLLHQLAKHGLELGEESGELRPEINRLGSGGEDVGIRGRRGFGG